MLDLLNKTAEDVASSNPEWAHAWASVSSSGRDRLRDALVFQATRISGPALHCGPTSAVMSAWILGARPKDLAPGLTHREASAWLCQSQHTNPVSWLWAQDPQTQGSAVPRTMAVARWALAALKDPRRRDAILEHLNEMDEIADEDLLVGGKSIARTLTCARRRVSGWKGPEELVPPQPWEARLPQGVRLLRTATDLVEEGAKLNHCVGRGSYHERIANNQSWIISISTASGRSTLEIQRPSGHLHQHTSTRNSKPPEGHDALAQSVVTIIQSHPS